MSRARGSHSSANGDLPVSAPLAAVIALSRRSNDGSGAIALRDAAFVTDVLSNAERLAVLGLVLLELARQGQLDAVKQASGLDVGRHLRLARRQAATWDLECAAVVSRLAAVGITPILLKGAALRLTAYDDPAARSFADIDVLIAAGDVVRAGEALAGAGYLPDSDREAARYREHHHHVILRKPGGFVVEVHWALDPPTSGFALDAESFRHDAREMTPAGGVVVRVPSPEHMVLHLAHQNLENGFSHLRRLVDVDRVIAAATDFNWARLASEARRMRVQSIVALTVRLAELLMNTAVPPSFMPALAVPAVTRWQLALLDPVPLVLEGRGERWAVEQLLLLWCLPDLGARIAHIRGLGAPGLPRPWLEGGSSMGGPLARMVALAKLATRQGTIYGAAATESLSGIGRRRTFWTAAVSHEESRPER